MRKYLGGILAIGLMGAIEAYGPTVCDADPNYRDARILLDRGDDARMAGNFPAADNAYLKGIALLGKTYRLNEDWGTIDDTGMGLLAAKDDDRQGHAFDATENREGELITRLALYRRGHACSGR